MGSSMSMLSGFRGAASGGAPPATRGRQSEGLWRGGGGSLERGWLAGSFVSSLTSGRSMCLLCITSEWTTGLIDMGH
jgi:hypothetical protein